jgi:sigma-B regulation protein RsbU (phosphoserine phosphatase)
VTGSTLVEEAPLAPAAVSLLEAFSRAYPGVEVRLWVAEAGGWRCAYPEGGVGGAPGAAGVRRAIDAGEGPGVELEVIGSGAGEGVELLAVALEQVLRYEREARSAARELGERYEEINLLYSISEVLGTVGSLQEAAQRILTEVAEVLGAKRASLWGYDPGDGRLHLAAAVGEEGLTGPISIDDPSSVTARVFRERQPVNVERGKAFPKGTRAELRANGHEAFLSVPINFSPRGGGSRTVGVITLVGRLTGERFNAGDARLLMAIASQIGAALETHRLMAENVRQERLVRELELAHDLQLKLLPEASQFEGPARVAARCAPAESVGGDFYYLFRFSDDRFGVMIGDVSSHGFSAALIMAMTISAAAIYAQDSERPAGVLRQVHRALIDELETTEMHLSLFYGVVDAGAGRLVYSNAGHPHAFRVAGSGEVQRLGVTDPPVGTVPLDEYGESVVPWTPGEDLLFLFTDGLSDAFSERAGSSGEAALLAEVVRLRSSPPAEILDHLFALAGRSTPTVPPDDRTSVILRI